MTPTEVLCDEIKSRTAISQNNCNGIARLSDGLFALSSGLAVAATSTELLENSANSIPSFICSDIQLDQDVAIDSGYLHFGPNGSIDLNGFKLTVNVPIVNPDNHQIFKNFVWASSYPDRYTNRGSVTGSFGGTRDRIPEWFGAISGPGLMTDVEGTANVNAINAALLSGQTNTLGYNGTRVLLGPGVYTINATIRMDSIRSSIQGSVNTRIFGLDPFDESYFINHEDFSQPLVPMIVMGWEWQVGAGAVNQDAGFSSILRDVFIECANGGTLPIAGVMWEHGLQERSLIETVGISNASLGIGCPRFQRPGHNAAPTGLNPPETNTCRFKDLWLTQPRSSDSIMMSISGYNYSIEDTTIASHRGDAIQTKPAAYLYSVEQANVKNIHLEHGGIAQQTVPGIVIPSINNEGGYHFDGVKMVPRSVPDIGQRSEVLSIQQTKASVTVTNMKNGSSTGTTPERFVTINDVSRAKLGGQTSQAIATLPTSTALYSRQRINGTWSVLTTDPGLA